MKAIAPPLVSVIIPTRNSASTISRCLLSIKGQKYHNIEVIIVDAFSADETKEILSQFSADLYSLDAERAAAKNYGVSVSRGTYVLFLDSDMTIEESVIEECIQECHYRQRKGVIIPERSVGKGFWVRVRDFERGLYAGSIIESPRFFPKTCVLSAGGFDEQVVANEEATLPYKLEQKGYDVRFRIKSCIFHIEDNFKMSKWVSKKRYYLASKEIYSLKYGAYSSLQFSITYRFKLFFTNGNWRKLLLNPVLATGLFCLKGLEYIYSRK